MDHHQSVAAGQPIDAETHIFCQRLSWALVNRIQGLLRADEVNDCAYQFYIDIRQHLQQERRNTAADNGRDAARTGPAARDSA